MRNMSFALTEPQIIAFPMILIVGLMVSKGGDQ